jgi:LysR family hydrogen peroxide-inducible transcriptional activator
VNIQQLEYLISVNNCRHFAKAAEQCFVTQPTLSTMIKQLEEELGIIIFNRTKHPVEPTEIGIKIIKQAEDSLMAIRKIKGIVDMEKTSVSGSFKLGIIPTLAPYIVPKILSGQHKKYSDLELIIRELSTANIISQLTSGLIDGGIVAGPINKPNFTEFPIYYEKFFAYVSPHDKLHAEKEIDLNNIDIDNVWLLENEHCLRGQIERLCKLKEKARQKKSIVRFESGSVDTLLNVVDMNPGLTIVPEMHAMGLPEDRQDNLRNFKNTIAVREVSLIVNKEYVRLSIINAILDIIKSSVPKSMLNAELKQYVVDL